MSSLNTLFIPVVPISLRADGTQAADELHSQHQTALPVVDDDGRYVGMVTQQAVDDAAPGATCSDVMTKSRAISSAEAPTTALDVLAETGLQMAPVVDSDGLLIGCVGREETLRMAAHLTGGDADGSSLSVWFRPADFEMARVIDVVEQTGAKVLSATTNRKPDKVELLLTTTALDPTPLTDALSRHGLQCSAYTNGRNRLSRNKLRDNYDALMAYLNI